MKLKVTFHNDGVHTWATVINEATGELVNGVASVAIKHSPTGGTTCVLELADFSLQTVKEPPPQRRQGPDL